VFEFLHWFIGTPLMVNMISWINFGELVSYGHHSAATEHSVTSASFTLIAYYDYVLVLHYTGSTGIITALYSIIVEALLYRYE
jgi:hypothetical protein